MRMKSEKVAYAYKSYWGTQLVMYLDERHFLGYKFIREELALQEFDRFCIAHNVSSLEGERLTRQGISYILKKYMRDVCQKDSCQTLDIHPHMLRHTKAMHMLRAGVDLFYIRDFLGHTDVSTTEVYAKADSEMKRKAIEKVCPNNVPVTGTVWQNNPDMLSWLMGLGKE